MSGSLATSAHTSEPTVMATRYRVAHPGLTEDMPEAYYFALTVEYRGRDLWAVLDCMGNCLSRSGKWHHERRPSARTDFWLKHHRFAHVEAMQRAVKALPKVTLNGMTAEQYIEWWKGRKA